MTWNAGLDPKIRIITGQPLSRQESDSLKRVAALPDVCQVIALPDLHLKPKLEAPSGLATATRGTIVLGLSSPSPGCGMALALTPLGMDDLDDCRLDDFFTSLARRLPVKRGPISANGNRLKERAGSAGAGAGAETYAEALSDIGQVLVRGAASAAEQLDLDPGFLAAMEQGGDALAALRDGLDPKQILETVPALILPLARQEFGMIGRGNHFFELQVVEELRDPQIATEWGVQAGQVVAMYHADSGRLGALVGRFYAHRRKNTWRGRGLELRYKTAFHLGQAGSPGEALERLSTYFAPRHFTALPAGSPAARRALLALGAATNYAYANRAAILAALGRSLGEVWSPALASPELLFDVSHNSIRLERSGERSGEHSGAEAVWMHRHNASRALPAGHPELAGGPFGRTGQPVLLPGSSQTSSYLCVAGHGAAQSLYSVNHGAGHSALRLGTGRPGKVGATRLYHYGRGFVGDQPHLADDGVEAVLDELTRAGLARPVARLRPLAVLKDDRR
jgi:RNA-splicing ligase RtcB